MLAKTLFLPLLAVVAVVLFGMGAEAAEWVLLEYGILREHISVPELSTFAKTGELSSSLRAHLKMANQKPDDLRRVLIKEIEVDPIKLSKVLNSLPGEILLDQVSKVMRTPTDRASRESLRGAIITSALADGNIRLIEVLENYPTPVVHVEGDRLVEIYNSINSVLGNFPKF